MTKRRPKPKLLNEAAFEQRLKKEADQYKIYYFAIAAICLILIVGLLSVTGEVFGFPILVGAMALGMALLVPNRTLVWAVKPRWVEPRIECSRRPLLRGISRRCRRSRRRWQRQYGLSLPAISGAACRSLR